MEIVLDILNKLIHDSQNICRFMTLNAMHSKLISLIICLINDNLTNTLSTPPPVRKKTILYIARLITLCTSTETSFYYKFRVKIFYLFEAPNRHNCCVTVVWKFLQVLISFWVNGVFKCNKLVQQINPGNDVCGSIKIVKLCC